MKLIILLFFATLGLFYVSCSKGSGNNLEKNINSADYITASNSIFPVSVGSLWKYNVETDNLVEDAATIELTSTNTTINSKVYHKSLLESKYYGDTSAYFYADNHVCALQLPDVISDYTFNLQILNDTMAVGHSWIGSATNSGLLNNIPVRAITTIKEKDITKTVLGRTYKDVTHTQVEIQYILPDQIIKYATFDFYFSQGIGIIENDYDQTGYHHKYYLLNSYNIK